MQLRRIVGFLFVSLVLSLSVSYDPVRAQETDRSAQPKSKADAVKNKKPPAAESPSATSVTVEKIMEQAVRNIAKRYNLNAEQAKYTEELMKRRVRSFLQEHEAEVWPLIREMLATQFGANPPQDEAELKRIGKAAKPLAQLAKEAILDGNQEWRRILTREQRIMHNHDLAEMEQTFGVIHERLDMWAEGKPHPEGLFPVPPPVDRSPPTPPRPPGGIPESLPEPPVIAFRESFFDIFVNEFIKENDLAAGQVTAARSILSEFKAKAVDFKASNKEELAEIASAQQEAVQGRDREKMAEVAGSRRELLQPVYELFDEMEERLVALLTSTQRARYEERRASADREEQLDKIDAELLPDESKVAKKPAKAAQPVKKPDGSGTD